MQTQKENHMYAIHIGERGGTTWEGIEEIESEQIGIAAIMRKGEVSHCKGNVLTNSGEIAKEMKEGSFGAKLINMMNGRWDRLEESPGRMEEKY